MVAATKILSIFFLFLSISFILARSADVDHEFRYDEKSENRPENWGKARPEWSTCSTGKLQSPIDIDSEKAIVVSNLGKLDQQYKSSNATLLNRGHDIMLKWQLGGGSFKINGTEYQLKQCHWHTPSEHKLNGKRFSLEAHLLHESNDGKNAVIGILYEIGQPDSFLSMIENDVKALAKVRGEERGIGSIDPNLIKVEGQSYYRYIGSLSIPPCTEGIVWTVDTKVQTASNQQIEMIRDAVYDDSKSNARPSQEINGRLITLNKPDQEKP